MPSRYRLAAVKVGTPVIRPILANVHSSKCLR